MVLSRRSDTRSDSQADPKAVTKPKKFKRTAWSEKQASMNTEERQEIEEEDETDTQTLYSYEDCAFVVDRLNFVLFFVSKVIITVAFFASITAGR